MIRARNRNYARQGSPYRIHNLYRIGTVRGRPVPKLAIRIIPHSPNRPITFQEEAVNVAGRNRDHARERNPAGIHHLYRVGTVRSRCVPQLAIIISPHRPHSPIVFQKYGVVTVRRNAHKIRERKPARISHLYGIKSVRIRPVPQLTVSIPSRRPNRPVRLQKDRVLNSSRNPNHPTQGIPR